MSVTYDPTTALAIAGLILYGVVVFGLCVGRIGTVALVAACLAMPVAQLAPIVFLPSTPSFLPTVFDQNIAQLDATVGMQPSIHVAIFLESRPALRTLCLCVYMLILVTLGVSAGCELRAGRRNGIGVIPNAFVAGLLGAAVYCLVPAVGPAAYFGQDYVR